jgi:hypothetical protein
MLLGRGAAPLHGQRIQQQRRFTGRRWPLRTRDPSAAPARSASSLGAPAAEAGAGLARRILSDPRLEGQPLQFLDVSERYWKVGAPGLA